MRLLESLKNFLTTHINAGVQTIKIENYFAVCIFNEGFATILNIMKIMWTSIGPERHGFVVRRNEARIELLFRNVYHKISISNRPIFFKLFMSFFYISLFGTNQEKIKIFNLFNF